MRPVQVSEMASQANIDEQFLKVSNKSYWEKMKRIFLKTKISSFLRINFFLRMLPIVGVIRKYRPRNYLIPDIVSGITMGLLHVPTGLATSLIAGLPVYVGMYTAFFAGFPYVFFSSNSHVSVIASLLSALILNEKRLPTPSLHHVNNNESTPNVTQHISHIDTPTNEGIEDSTVTLFYSGILLLLMYVMRLGFIVWYINSAVQAGFVSGVIFVLVIGQIPTALGVSVKQARGMLSLFYNAIALVQSVPSTNIACLLFTAISIISLLFVKSYINKKFAHKLKFPIPIDFIIIVIAIVVSYFVGVNTRYSVPIVGYVPVGFPTPVVPNLNKGLSMIPEIISITILNLMTYTMALRIFGERQKFRADFNQELLALGISNIVASFFPCMPVSASFIQTMIMEAIGGKTIIAHLISTLVLLVIMTTAGKLLEPLPLCILASMIIVAPSSMLENYTIVKHYWKTDRYDLFVWIVTFLFITCLDLQIGLFAGIGISLVLVFFRMQMTSVRFLGRIPSSTSVYEDVTSYRTSETMGVKVIKYDAPLTFFTSELFLSKLHNEFFKERKRKIELRGNVNSIRIADEENPGTYITDGKLKGSPECCSPPNPTTTHVILDCSAVSYIDGAGATVLRKVRSQFSDEGIAFVLASCTQITRNSLRHYGYPDDGECAEVYPSIENAVIAIQERLDNAICNQVYVNNEPNSEESGKFSETTHM